jgi:hypothetical protein
MSTAVTLVRAEQRRKGLTPIGTAAEALTATSETSAVASADASALPPSQLGLLRTAAQRMTVAGAAHALALGVASDALQTVVTAAPTPSAAAATATSAVPFSAATAAAAVAPLLDTAPRASIGAMLPPDATPVVGDGAGAGDDVDDLDAHDDESDSDGAVFHDQREHDNATSPATAWPAYSMPVVDAVYRCAHLSIYEILCV